jgi:hypothetical protein
MSQVKVSGGWKKLVGGWTKINGEWKKATSINPKINGEWKTGWKNAFEPPSFLSYPATIVRNQSITWNTEDIPNADYELQVRYNGGNWSASTFHPENTGVFKVSDNVNNSTVQFRVRAVAPTTRDKESLWVEGPVRDLTPEQLSVPPSISYPSTITKGQKVTISFPDNASNYVVIEAIYKSTDDGAQSVDLIFQGEGKNSVEYTVSKSLRWETIQFRVKRKRTGYYDSDYRSGSVVTLTQEKLATPSTISYPTPYKGQTITVSWTGVTNATSYQLEVDTEDTGWVRLYWSGNKSTSASISRSTDKVQFRVRAVANGYRDSEWRTGTIRTVALPPLKKTTWNATLTTSWRDHSNWGWRDVGDSSSAAEVNYVYQGEWGWGNHKGLAWFNHGNIRSTLKDKEIVSTRLYFYRINSGGYVAGQAIKLWTHNYSSKPAGNPSLRVVQGPFSSFARGEGKWITVSNEVARRIRDGEACGIALHRENGAGYLYMSSNVKLEVTYR